MCVCQALRQQKHLLQRQLEDLKEHYQQLVDEQDERVSPHSLLQRGGIYSAGLVGGGNHLDFGKK